MVPRWSASGLVRLANCFATSAPTEPFARWRRPLSLPLALPLSLPLLLPLLLLPSWETAAAQPAAAPAPKPLHQRIDEALEREFTFPPAGSASDADFLRRAYLALAGVIPSAAESRAFLEDPAADKRPRLIEQLLDDPRFEQHLADTLDHWLMERRADKHVKSDEWRKYLLESVAANKPFDVLAREVLESDGADPQRRAAAKFFLDREAEPNLVTRDIGRMFFGVDLQCAQCHDHPLIDDYYQADYYGIFAFVGRSYLFTDKKKKLTHLAEKAEGDTKFKSVFTSVEGESRPRLPTGELLAAEPTFEKGQEYQVKPGKEVAGVPHYSRRKRLAELATNGENLAFNRNVANRMWQMLMGRGLVEPPDLHHSGNPPANPALMRILADEIVALRFDLRAFLKEIALSRAFERSLEVPENWRQLAALGVERLPSWKSECDAAESALEAAKLAMQQAGEQFTAAQTALEQAAAAAGPLQAAVKKASDAWGAAEQAHRQAQAAKQAAAQLESALTMAAGKAQDAAKLLPAEPELAGAAGKLAARRDQARQNLEKLGAAATAAAQQLAQLQQARQQATDAAAPALTQLANARQQQASQQQAYAAAQQSRTDAASQFTAAQRRVAEAEALALSANSHAAWEAAQLAAHQARLPLEGQAVALTAEQQKLDSAQQGLAAGQETLASLAKQVAAAAAELEQQTEATALLAEAGSQLSGAVKNLAGDPSLRAAEQQLQQQLAQLQTNSDALARRHAELTSAMQQQASQQALLEKQRDEAQQRAAALREQLAAAEKQAEAAGVAEQTLRGQLDEAMLAVEQQWSRQFALSGIHALTPEQLAWSALQATGMTDAQLAAAEAELEKKQPLSEADRQTPAKAAERRREAILLARQKLAPNVKTFVGLFSSGAGQPDEFFATADQALFFANGPQIRGWIAAGGATLRGRLEQAAEPAQVAAELYLSVLSRRPSDAETQSVVQYLQSREKDRSAALQELIWGLLTSIEFRFNH